MPKRRRALIKTIRVATAVVFSSAPGLVKAQNPLALAPVGTTELRVLSPSLLELTLVTTKDPDPAPVTRWNFVGTNFALTLPSATQFNVSVNGNSVPVSEVGFRRRAIYAPLKVRDLRIGNSLFLKLAAPLVDGQNVAVRNPSGTLWNDSTTTFSAAVNPTRVNPAIHVNQVGYLPNESKKAMVGYYLGSMGELPITSSTFNLIDAASGAVQFTGSLPARRDIGYTYSPTPYQSVHEADFSAFRTPGEYVLQVPGMGTSQKFLINEGTAAVFARTLALGLYHQRCGGKNELPYTRHEHAACHMAAAEVPTLANTAVNAILASTSSDYSNNPLHTAPQLNSVDASLYPFLNNGAIDVSGGHHDAGDYSKYTINSAGLIHHLVFAADTFAGVAALDNLGIPESGDGRSDLLQEAKWEADFLAKMQDADGGFYFLVYPRDRRYEDNVLPDKGDPQVVFPKTTAVTAAAVGALAEIASSPTFKAQFPNEAALYLDKARKGWAFLVNAIKTHGKNGSYQKITHYGNEFMHDDELAWAAAAMFVATGDPAIHTQLKAWYDPSSPSTRRWSWWRLFEGYGCAARTYAFAARTGRLPAALLDPDYLAKCTTEITAAGDDIARFAQQSAYGTSFPEFSKSYRSAGWYFSSERAFELAAAHQLRPSSAYTDALISNMNYEGGCNPVNVPYITGLGWQRWRDIVHQYAQNDYQTLPPTGFPLGNVQAGFAYLENYRQSLGQLCYPPDGASSAPYPFYDRWGDSFNTTTEFVVVDQARSLATYACLLANTAVAEIPYTRVTPSITGVPASIPADQNITATFHAPGVDLIGARIVWEARDQQPVIGHTFTFSAKDSGLQWLEVEALLPDGRRLICKTNFTATSSETVLPNSFKSAPETVTSDIVALYQLDSTLTDAAGKNSPLSLAGNARINGENLGWMANRSGQALRFDDLGDKATVSIPTSLFFASGSSEISVEAMVFVESYKGWNRSPAKLLCLEKAWDTSLKWFEDTYSGTHISGGTSFDCTGLILTSALPLFQWHHLRISISTAGYAVDVNGVRIVSASSTELSGWNSGTAILELGNFSGWIDEIVVRTQGSSTLSNAVVLTPLSPSNLKASSLSESQIALSWTDNATDEQGSRVYSSADNINYVESMTTSANATGCTMTGLGRDTLYSFAVKTFNAAGESAETIVSARTLVLSPARPTGLLTNTAAFVKADTTASGSWNGQYGADGALAPYSDFVVPAYVQVNAYLNYPSVWENPSTRRSALEKRTSTLRFATRWQHTAPFNFYLQFKDTEVHRVSFYFLDFENLGRQQKVEFFDYSTGQLLASTTIGNFQNGVYSTWELKGKIAVRLSAAGPGSSVLSGIFFDPLTPRPSGANTAAFVKSDTTTSGSWKGEHGADGALAPYSDFVVPANVQVNAYLNYPSVWENPSTRPSALEKRTSSARFATCWQHTAPFYFYLQFKDTEVHRVSFYFHDFQALGRQQAVEFYDYVTGARLGGTTVAGFQNGVYSTWDLKGKITIKITPQGPGTAVLSGIFFDPAPAASANAVRFLGANSTTAGNWKGVFGAQGMQLAGDVTQLPSYPTVNFSGQLDHVWNWSTTDSAALERGGSTGRVAACWYAPESFDVAVNVADGSTRKLSFYSLDWDMQNRTQRIEVLDRTTGVLLHTVSVSGFQSGVYHSYDVKGNVIFRFARSGQLNAVMSGIFVDAPNAPL